VAATAGWAASGVAGAAIAGVAGISPGRGISMVQLITVGSLPTASCRRTTVNPNI
jgi:hypothetical protein